MEWLAAPRWSPYIVGFGIGVLSWLAFLLSDKPIGCSTAFARTSGMIERAVRGRKVETKPYYRAFPPGVDWEWMLVLGIVIGSLVSSLLSRSFRFMWVPGLWAAAFGNTPAARMAVALFGGVCMGFGSRWAGGCTSGHGISGTLQLALSSWIASICFFAGGIATAFFIFRVLGG
ncbi:YeeE/YedE family protein [candidate division WOR-3 bacterium]|nr:YeeE/YedE family protein [candidate division WOR-3 bacterium]